MSRRTKVNDGTDHLTARTARREAAPWPASTSARALTFIVGFLVLQVAYRALHASAYAAPVLHATTTMWAATLLTWLEPSSPTWADGGVLRWGDRHLLVGAGCDGADVWTIHASAALAAPLPWHLRWVLFGWGSVLVWILNQARVVALVQLHRHWRDALDAAHAVWAPLALLVMVAAFNAWLLGRLRAAPMPR